MVHGRACACLFGLSHVCREQEPRHGGDRVIGAERERGEDLFVAAPVDCHIAVGGRGEAAKGAVGGEIMFEARAAGDIDIALGRLRQAKAKARGGAGQLIGPRQPQRVLHTAIAVRAAKAQVDTAVGLREAGTGIDAIAGDIGIRGEIGGGVAQAKIGLQDRGQIEPGAGAQGQRKAVIQRAATGQVAIGDVADIKVNADAEGRIVAPCIGAPKAERRAGAAIGQL